MNQSSASKCCLRWACQQAVRQNNVAFVCIGGNVHRCVARWFALRTMSKHNRSALRNVWRECCFRCTAGDLWPVKSVATGEAGMGMFIENCGGRRQAWWAKCCAKYTGECFWTILFARFTRSYDDFHPLNCSSESNIERGNLLSHNFTRPGITRLLPPRRQQ